MRVGVVIPVYNHEKYVARAIGSVLGQTRAPDRVVVIDDGSRDASLEVCRSFAGRGVEVHGQENRGAHETINLGVRMAAADCDVVSILNSDDHYDPRRLELCLPLLEDPDAAVACSGLLFIDQDDVPLPADHPRGRWLRAAWSRWGSPDLDLCQWMGQANFVMTSSNIIARREFLLRHPFKPYRFNHDYYFLAQAAIREVIRVRGEPLVNYRVHTTNTINTTPAALIRELLMQHLELYRDLSAELRGSPRLRAAFSRYMRGAWDNISAFPAGVFQVVLAELASSRSPEEFRDLLESMTEEDWPELRQYPNRHLAGGHAGGDAFAAGGALSDRLERMREERDEARAEAEAARELARLRQRLASSRWVALGALLGPARRLASDSGKSAREKLESLRRRVAGSRWLRLGGWSGG